ncbi:unnamed protein product [Fusarium graminearum]|nr:unnamed protein product [Fusarium graminearum]VTO87971.1 unnamed protein product [Fusarium graminearum]
MLWDPEDITRVFVIAAILEGDPEDKVFFHFQLRHYPPTPFNYVASQVQLQRVAASSSSLAMKALVCDSGQRPAW